MEKLFRLLFVVVIISSCSKNNGSSSGSTTLVLPDTLSTGWSKITTLPRENFKDIFFTDNTNGFAVSTNGIYKSTNAGTDWTKLNSTSAINLLEVSAINNNACFINGSTSISVTQNGGSTFANPVYNNPGGADAGFSSCFFSSAAACYFCSDQYVWKSTDAGLTIDTVFHFQNIGSSSSMFFLNDTEGWLLRLDGVYKTTDGGELWSIDTTLTDGYGKIQFLDSNNGYFSNYGTINKTTDAGLSWLPVFQSTLQIYTDIDFINVNEGYCSFNNKILKTTDAGTTWTIVVALGNEYVSKIHFTDVNHGWACTSDGVIVKYEQ
ncbi:MAG: hypothetical protein ABI402_06995 [Ferruginibacter sp.]